MKQPKWVRDLAQELIDRRPTSDRAFPRDETITREDLLIWWDTWIASRLKRIRDGQRWSS